MVSTKNFHPDTDPLLKCSHCGMEGVKQEALDKLQLIRDDFGKGMRITSSFRCSKHPVEARKSKPGTHNKGVAFDIACTSSADRYTLVELAYKHGAKGIGIHKSFVHIDFDETRPATVMWLY